MMGDRGWFADWDNEATTDYGWQPCLETGIGHIPCFEVWFKTRAECEQWIAENVIGVEWLPGEPTAIPAALVAPSRRPGGGNVSGKSVTGLTDAGIEQIADAFVEANRAEFMDTDFDLPILHAISALVARAWHEGYGAGSSDATDGWLKPGSPRTSNPYARVPSTSEGEGT